MKSSLIRGLCAIGWRIGKIQNKTIKIGDYGPTPGWTKAKKALQSSEKSSKLKGTLKDNMEHAFKSFFDFVLDPDVADITEFRITSTYRDRDVDKREYPGHWNAVALDLGADYRYHFTLKNYNKELATRVADTLGRYNVKSILFNCPYVVDKSKTKVSGAILSHHHHFHIDYAHTYTSRGSEYLCHGTDERGRDYTCINYDNCDYTKMRK